MTLASIKTQFALLVSQAGGLVDMVRVADRNRKSLVGDNPYGRRFSAACIDIAKTERGLAAAAGHLPIEKTDWEEVVARLAELKSASTSFRARITACNKLREVVEASILPAIDSVAADPVPTSEHVLSMAVVAGTRRYIEQVVVEANGCYEHQWYNGCSVMIRRLVETLIIELYEHEGRAGDIKGADGNFYMLGKLVEILLADAAFNLGRETKAGLPLLKSLGDRAAHNRYFLAKKPDIDEVVPKLRVVAEELILRAKLKKEK